MTNGEKLCIDFPDVEIVAIVPNEIVVIKKLDNISMYSNQSFSYKWWNTEYKEPVIRDNGVKNELNRVKNELESTTKNNVAQERYQDLIEYFGDEKVAKTILEDRKEFKAWLERLRWNVKRADEIARELERIKETTKNDLPHCQYSDEEIAKSFIEDVEAVKDQLPCGEQMDFLSTFDEFAKDYGFKDKDEVYTNGSELIPVFRVKQWLKHISIIKNDLAVDCISREDALMCLTGKFENREYEPSELIKMFAKRIKTLPSVTPQEPTTKENLAIDLIDRADLLKAMDTCDKFGNDPDEGLIPLRTPALQDRYVPYVHYYDMVNCVKGMPSVAPSINNSSECIDKDLAVDCIDRQATLDAIIKRLGIKNETYLLEAERAVYQQILAMPSVTPQLSSGLAKNSKKLEKNFGESDCISRQAVLDLIADYDLSMGQVVRGIHALSSVKPQEPRKGHWIEHPHEAGANWEYSRYECSECHEWEEDDSDYCPSCGSYNGGASNGNE